MGHLGTFSYTQPSDSSASLAESYPFYEEPCPEYPEASSGPARKPGAGIPYKCFCGLTPITQTSTTEKNPGRVFYGCKNSKNGRRHVFKWLDEALMDEIEEIRTATEKQGECIRQMEDWYNSHEYPAAKALEVEVSEMKELLRRCRFEGMAVKNPKEWMYLFVFGLIFCLICCIVVTKK